MQLLRFRKFFYIAIAAFIILPYAVSAEDKWTKVESANFRLVGNAGEKEIKRVAMRMERFREAFLRLLPSLRHDVLVPTTIIVFKDERSFHPYKPLNADGKPADWVAGYFRSGDDTNYIVLSAEREREQTYQTIYHEYVHFLLGNSFGRTSIPTWLNEGIAEYYDQLQFSGDSRVVLGSANRSHLEAIRTKKLMPFEAFLAVDHDTLHAQAAGDASSYYTQAWAFTHMLMHGRSRNGAADLQAFLDLMIKGEPVGTAAKRAFGSELTDLGDQLEKYIAQGLFGTQSLTLTDPIRVDEGNSAARIRTAEAKAILGDLLLGSERFDEAYAHLTEAVREYPDSVAGNSSLGMWLTKKGRYAEGRKYLAKARSLPEATYLEHYRYAYLLSREPMAGRNWISYYPEQTATEIRAALARSIELNPRYPESYRLFAFVSIVRSDKLDESIEYIKIAQGLSPGNELLHLDLASILARKGDFSEAEYIARRVRETGRDPAARQHADYVLENVQNLRRNLDAVIAAKISREPGRLPVITEHLEPAPTEAELAALEHSAKLVSLNKNLRKPADSEVRVLGELTKIECERKGNVKITFSAGQGRLRLQSEGFEGLFLKTYRALDMKELGCQYSNRGYVALLTYVPSADGKAGIAGTVTAIEFMPEFFTITDAPAILTKKPVP